LQRAIERGNVVVAEITARELGGLGLPEALELTALIAMKDWERARRASARWLARWIGEHPRATLDEALVVAGLLAGLGDRRVTARRSERYDVLHSEDQPKTDG